MKKIIRFVIYGILFSAVIFGFIYIGTYDFKDRNKKENEKVALKFPSIKNDNKFVEVNIDQAINIVKNDGLILFANPKNKWADKYAYILNEAVRDTRIKNIAIIDVTVDRQQNSLKYQRLIKALGDYVIYDDLDNAHLYMPAFVIIKNKKIIYFDNETAMNYGYVDFDKYWTLELEETKKNILLDHIDEYLRVD